MRGFAANWTLWGFVGGVRSGKVGQEQSLVAACGAVLVAKDAILRIYPLNWETQPQPRLATPLP